MLIALGDNYQSIHKPSEAKKVKISVSLLEKCPNTEFFSGPYFPAFELNAVRMRENTDQKKLRIWTLFTQCVLYGE